MIKSRSSPRKGGKRSKATPPNTPMSSNEEPVIALSTKPKGPPSKSAANKGMTPPVKKPKKARSTGKKTAQKKTKGSDSTMDTEKEIVSSENKDIFNDLVHEQVEDDAVDSSINESLVINDKAALVGETDVTSTHASIKVELSKDESSSQSVGEELLEQLSKVGKKKTVKKAMRNCNNCGNQSPVSRAKKCPHCGKNFFTSSLGYSRDIICPQCDSPQRFSSVKSSMYCGKCNYLLTPNKKKDKSTKSLKAVVSQSDVTSDIESKSFSEINPAPNINTNSSELLFDTSCASVGYGSEVDKQSIKNEEVIDTYSDTLPSTTGNSSTSSLLQRSLSSPAGTSSNKDKIPSNEERATSGDDMSTGKTKKSKGKANLKDAELKKLIKRKILGDMDSTEDYQPPTKKPRKQENMDMTLDEQLSPHSPPESCPISHQSSASSISSTVSTNAVSSPLMEYAQKISARLFIPPEIPPQEGKRGRPQNKRNSKATTSGTRNVKSQTMKNKRALKETEHDSGSLPPPLTSQSTLDSSIQPPQLSPFHSEKKPLSPPGRLIEIRPLISQPPSRHSAPPTDSDASIDTSNFPTQRASSETPDLVPVPPHLLPPLIPSSQAYHDPTINSIRTYSHTYSNTGIHGQYLSSPPKYSQSSLYPPPPLLPPPPSTHTPPLVLQGDSKYTIHSGHVVSKEMYPTYTNTSVPPLVPVGSSQGFNGNNWSVNSPYLHPQPVAHRTVIVDPVKLRQQKAKVNQVPEPSPLPILMVSSPPCSPSPPPPPVSHILDRDSEEQFSNKINFEKEALTDNTMSSMEEVGSETPVNEKNPSVKSIHGEKHSKRKQKVELVETSEADNGITLEGDSHRLLAKKKKKKKKKEREKDRERSHHSKSKSDKYLHAERKAKKKSKRDKKKEKETDGSTQTEDDDTQSQVESLVESEDKTPIDIHKTEPVAGGSNGENGESSKKPVFYSVKIKDCTIHQIQWGEHQMALLVPSQAQQQMTPTPDKESTPISTTGSTIPNTPASSSIIEGETEGLPVPGKGRLLRSSRKKDVVKDTEDLIAVLQETKVKKKRKSKGKSKEEELETEQDLPPPPPPPPPPPLPSPPPLLMDTKIEPEDGDDVDNSVPIEPSCLPASFSIYELRNKIFSGFPPRTVHAFTYKLRIKTHRPPLYWIHILKRIGGLPETCHMCRLLDVDSLKTLCALHKLDVPPCLDLLLNNSNMKGRKMIDLSMEDPTSFISNPEVLHLSLPQCSFQGALSRKKSVRKRPHKFIAEQTNNDSSPKKPKRNQEEKKEKEAEVNREEEREHEVVEKILNEEAELHVSEKKPKRSKKAVKQIPPPLFPVTSQSISPDDVNVSPHSKGSLGRKKPCPNCGYSVLRKSKKCAHCGKPFGVFTFGRRLCTYCGHINLARMSACFKCGQSLDKAPTAIPKDLEESQEEEAELPVVKLDFKFGVRKKRRIHSIPSNNSPSTIPVVNKHHCPGSNVESPDEIFQDESEVSSPVPPLEKKKRRGDQHLGYHFGKIPWNDADLALLITSNGNPKFCLQEVCGKVLRYHNKLDVFEMVRNLHLQLELGDTNLLKKLQALGLHPNRSPMCRLIVAEDLFALMDALEELVPEEVHQHLETIGAHSPPLGSENAVNSSLPLPPSLLPSNSASVSNLPFVIGEDQAHGFESTLHEIHCSDGQSLAMLRSWNGEHFLCLLEVWRRHFPEVNRSHLSSVIKRLEIETQIPTSQQTNLLRAAGVISVRGAPGRLMRVSDMQRLLDDFSIPLQVGGDFTNGDKEDPILSTNGYLNYNHTGLVSADSSINGMIKQDTNSETEELASCMKILLDVVEPESMATMITSTQERYLHEIKDIEQEMKELSTQENILHNHILGERELCTALTDEISFLTVTNHTHMSELVRLSCTVRQALHDIDTLTDFTQVLHTC